MHGIVDWILAFLLAIFCRVGACQVFLRFGFDLSLLLFSNQWYIRWHYCAKRRPQDAPQIQSCTAGVDGMSHLGSDLQ